MSKTTTLQSKINKTVIDRMQVGDVVWDTELKGFGARRQKNSISYFLKYRVNGRQRWITIGRHHPYTPNRARQEAIAYKLDPNLIINKKKEINATLSELIERFKLARYPNLKPKTRKDYNSLLERHILPAFGKMEIKAIDRSNIVKFHQKMAQTPRRANLALAVLSTILNWAEEFEFRDLNTNPCKRIKKFPEKKRERYLSKDEIGRLGKALNEAEKLGHISMFSAAAIRLLILTGARRGEILNLRWDYIDMEREIIFLPDSKTGAKQINLNKPAIEVLQSLPQQVGNQHVILGRVHGKPMVNISKPWGIVRKAADLDDFRLHDLRHCFASTAAEEGGSLLYIGKLLGHKKTSTTERYAHLADNSAKELNEKVGRTIQNRLL